MTARQRLRALERIGRPQVQAPEPPPTWSRVAALWRSTLEIIGDVDPALLARVDRIGARPGPAPDSPTPATKADLVLSCPEACEITNAIVARLSCGSEIIAGM